MPDDYTALLRRLRAVERRLDKSAVVDRPAPVVGIARTDAGQVIANNTVTIVDFGTVAVDTAGAITTGAAWHYTAPLSGYYVVNAAILYAGTTTWALGEYAALEVYIGGVLAEYLDRDDEIAGGVVQHKWLGGAKTVYMAAGALLDIRTVQISGGPLALFNDALYNTFNIHKIN